MAEGYVKDCISASTKSSLLEVEGLDLGLLGILPLESLVDSYYFYDFDLRKFELTLYDCYGLDDGGPYIADFVSALSTSRHPVVLYLFRRYFGYMNRVHDYLDFLFGYYARHYLLNLPISVLEQEYDC